MPHASVEELLIAWLPAHLGELAPRYCRDELPEPKSLANMLPLIHIERYGGADRQIVLDDAAVDIDCYTHSRATARALAEAVRQLMKLQLPGHMTADFAVVTNVITLSGPVRRAYDNTSIRRFGASYRLAIQSRL